MGRISQPIAYPLASSPPYAMSGRAHSQIITLTISDTAHDGQEHVGTDNWDDMPTSPVSGFLTFGNFTDQFHVGYLFENSGISAQQTIKKAELNLWQRKTVGAPAGNWSCVDVDNFGGFDGTKDYPSNLTLTAASDPFVPAPSASLEFITHDVTTAVQEVINRASFGGNIGLVGITTSTGNNFDNIEDVSFGGGENHANLVIEI